MNRLLVVRGLTHDSCGGLAGILFRVFDCQSDNGRCRMLIFAVSTEIAINPMKLCNCRDICHQPEGEYRSAFGAIPHERRVCFLCERYSDQGCHAPVSHRPEPNARPVEIKRHHYLFAFLLDTALTNMIISASTRTLQVVVAV